MNEPSKSVINQKPPSAMRQVSTPFDVWPIISTSASQLPTQASSFLCSALGPGGAGASCAPLCANPIKTTGIDKATRLDNNNTLDMEALRWNSEREDANGAGGRARCATRKHRRQKVNQRLVQLFAGATP